MSDGPGTKPILKSVLDLREADFDTHPIWMNVHGEVDQPWYDETDEITYRPWPGGLPFDSSDPFNTVLVRTTFHLADGSAWVGYLTAPYAQRPDTWSSVQHSQPCLFGPTGGKVRFYWGSSRIKPHLKAEQYKHLQRAAEQVFPIRYAVAPGLFDMTVEGVLDAFYWWDTDAVPRVVRVER